MKSKTFLRFGGSSLLALSAMLLAPGLSAPLYAQEAEEAVASSDAKAAAPQMVAGIPEWGITDAELPADPSVVYGVLENGMRYALKRNTQPPGEASMRFLFEVGTRDERDEEEGAAHFVEHMAFNGSTNIPEGELVPRLERLGLAFGADTNAETAPHYTMYKLDLPKLDEETIESSFEILREMAGELTIAPDAVEREKGIIVSEYQVRNTVGRRQIVEIMRSLLADSDLAERLTAEPEATRSLTAETLRGFYEGFYRPDNSVLVVVGDFDLAEMEQRIRQRFSSWEAKGEARAPFKAELANLDTIKIKNFVDPAATEIVQLQRVRPFEPAANTVEEFRGDLMDQVAAVALNLRLAEYARAEDAKTLGGGALSEDLFQSAKIYTVAMLAKEGDWASALATGEQEWRRAVQFGFTNSEIAQAKASILSALQTAVEQSNSERSAAVAEELAISSLEDTVRMSPAMNLALYQQIESTITPDAVKANFLAKWGDAPSFALVATKTPVEGGSQAIASVLDASKQVAVSAPAEAVEKAFAYTDFGEAGTVAQSAEIADLGIRTIRFDNGVQLNLKKTDFEPGSITVQVEVGHGISRLTDKAGLGLMAQVVAGADDLGEHTATELARLTAGKQVGYGYSLSDEAVVMARSTTPADLLFQLQLLAAQITDTAFSAQAQRQWEGVVPLLGNNLTATPQGVFAQGFPAVLTNGDPRFGFTDPAVLGALSMDSLKEVVGGQFASGPIEIGIVGDFDEAEVIAAVAQTLGALERPAMTEIAPMPPVTFRADTQTRFLFHKGEPEQGMMALSWPTTDGLDLRSTLTRQMLAQLFDLEALRVLREELGATYTPSGVSRASNVYEGYGHISLIAPAEPASMDEVSSVIRNLAKGLGETAPSADAMQRVRQPILEGFERADGSNGNWAGFVVDAQSNPERLDTIRNRAEVLASITPEEILAAAKEYLTAQPIELRVVPPPPVVPAE